MADTRKEQLLRQQLRADKATLAETLQGKNEDEAELQKKRDFAAKFGLSPDETRRYLTGSQATPFETIKEAAGVVKQPEGTEKTLAAKVTETPSTVPVGGEGTKPSKPEAITTSVASQPETKKAKTLAGTIADARAGKGAGKASDDKVQKDTISTLDDVVKEVEKDSRFQNDPVRTDLISLRADAYKAYKEKANRNEWLDLAEKALNAIGQFAAARSATGGFVAGFPQSKTDYAGRTEQAFREYQTELGTIGEQARAEERAGEKLEAAKEREIARRQRTISERLADERAARAEAADKERALIAAGGKESLAAARKETQDVKDTFARIGTTVKNLDDEESRLQKEIKAVQEFALSKDKDKSSAALALASSLDPNLDTATIEAEISKRSGFDLPWSDAGLYTRSATARQQVSRDLLDELKQQFANVTAKKKRLQQAQESGILPQAVAPTTAGAPAPASTGQAAPASGTVTMRLPDGRVGTIPAANKAAFLKSNPGAVEVQ